MREFHIEMLSVYCVFAVGAAVVVAGKEYSLN